MAAEETIKQWLDLLKEFSQHQIEVEETFMGVCRYKWERFEEICSRVLKFFFNPNEKHGFRDLWFEALRQLINRKKYCDIRKEDCDIDKMQIRLEVPTSNADEEEQNETDETTQENGDEPPNESTKSNQNSKGRIDLILKLPSLVITIENKISAHLDNNPLDTYRIYVNQEYSDINENNRLFYILTARKLNDSEKAKAQNKFDVITYEELFIDVEALLGKYVAKGEQKYLTFMLDFIQTIRNRVKEMELTEFEKKFFANNHTVIGDMTDKYTKWKNKVWNKRKTNTTELHTDIEAKTSAKWELDTYKDVFLYNLSKKFKEGTKYKIGIESNFDFDDEYDDENNPIGKFCIFITTWDIESWEPYENIIRQQWEKWQKEYPTHNFNEFDVALDKGQRNDRNRVYLHMPPIELKKFEGKNVEAYKAEIIGNLTEYYYFLKEITDNIDK